MIAVESKRQRDRAKTVAKLKPGDVIGTSLLRYRVTWAFGSAINGVLVAVWNGAGWAPPRGPQAEESLWLDGGEWRVV